MKISVITVCFNSAKTIKDTLDSVRDQTHPDVEHIVIDGNSRDATKSLIEQHGSHVAIFKSEPDKGIYDAMNKGLALATGDIVGCLNADDMLASKATLAHIAAAMETQFDMIYGDLVYVDAERTDKVVRHWDSGEFSTSRLRHGWMPPHPTFYVRRNLIQGEKYDLRYRIAADYDFMLRCLKKSPTRVQYLPEVLVHMRNGGASNRSLQAMLRKSQEDLDVIRRNSAGGVLTLAAKNLRKIPQFFK
ncbi:glycosyltransferase family 2 protein [Pelomonas sp. UHG3]|uniref:Glycosyltransferase family 2 protein n=1 Tax=Roseateles hydrophilus TaxID=2975054 RepID=A0ACC6CEL3_9BURK|nr:glycosyltransferase family 2 protein [Pelomonas sp. UHG3]MCY4746805.1 glycosyltransferase family 2 protein [Pelomonas sp. UHG3]